MSINSRIIELYEQYRYNIYLKEMMLFGSPQQKIGDFTQTKLEGFA